MLQYFQDFIDSLISVISLMTIVDVLDIAILSFLIYQGIKLVHETRAEQLIKGILIIAVLLFLFNQFEFKVMSVIGDSFFSVGIIAIIVMFQPELRRILEKMGRANVVKNLSFTLDSNQLDVTTRIGNEIEQTVIACERLSRTATGALIVVERQTKLGEQIDTGTILNAVPSAELYGNIFFPNTPLHDGAVILRDGLIHAAGCFLPKPQKEELISKELGSRHRAAIGMSEVSDAIIIIVSEETGIISVAENGELSRGFSKESLKKLLIERIMPVMDEKKTKKAKAKKQSRKTIAKEADKE